MLEKLNIPILAENTPSLFPWWESCLAGLFPRESCFCPRASVGNVESRTFKAFRVMLVVLQFGCWCGLFSESPLGRTLVSCLNYGPQGYGHNSNRTLLASSFFSWLLRSASALMWQLWNSSMTVSCLQQWVRADAGGKRGRGCDYVYLPWVSSKPVSSQKGRALRAYAAS